MRGDEGSRDRLAERLRQLGLPSVLSPADRSRGLVRRSAGVLWAIVPAQLSVLSLRSAALEMAAHPEVGPDDLDVPDEALAYLLGAMVVLLFVPVVGAAMAWLVRRVTPRVGTALGVLGAVLVVALPLLLTGIGFGRLAGLAVLGVVFLGAFAGVGSVLAWAGRRVLREFSTLGPMVARVLPTFMLASLFFFYNAEIWQVMVALPWSRIHAVVAVMLLLTVFLVAVTTRDEVSDLLTRRREDPDLHDGPPLRWDERFNVLLVPSLVTLIQTALFASLVFLFFLGFGQLSVSDATIGQWTGRPLDESWRNTLGLPFEGSLVKVAWTLAAFSALNFAASASSDQGHRSRFVAPLIGEAILGLETRDAYLAARRRTEPSDPAPARDGEDQP